MAKATTAERLAAWKSIAASLDDLREEIARLEKADVSTHRLRNILQTMLLDVMLVEPLVMRDADD